MELATYTELIKQLPYKDQAFETKRKIWEPYGDEEPFIDFYKNTLSNQETITFSRGELFSITKEDPCKAIFAIILWGYPKGYTLGFNMATLFPQFLEQVNFLSEYLSIKMTITSDELKYVLAKCNGVGLSTLSKLLYFFNILMGENRCLIMDARIIRVLNKTQFTELSSLWGINEQNSKHRYTGYLEVCAQLSKKHGYKPDQLELFLFMFGNNLKK
ncbi:hypothetical protein [Sediminibacterium sp.]|uniref:8-oxoguanine DNA glycosylase OGG fold protein n=1 Tax=Sediminibacterium sp. TaxID=1917865 RepID=UPI003F709C96